MNVRDCARLRGAIQDAIESLEYRAQGYGFQGTPEYDVLIEQLTSYSRYLKRREDAYWKRVEEHEEALREEE